MARLARSLLKDEVVVELAGKRQSNFYFDILGRTLRGHGSISVRNVGLPGIYLAFDFTKQQVRVIDPLSYADGVPRLVSSDRVVESFIQPEQTYSALGALFDKLVNDVSAFVAEGQAKLVQGKFPNAPTPVHTPEMTSVA